MSAIFNRGWEVAYRRGNGREGDTWSSAGYRSILLLVSVVSHMRPPAQAELLVPRARTAIRQRRAFSVAGPTAWNGLPVALRLTPVAQSALFLWP